MSGRLPPQMQISSNAATKPLAIGAQKQTEERNEIFIGLSKIQCFSLLFLPLIEFYVKDLFTVLFSLESRLDYLTFSHFLSIFSKVNIYDRPCGLSLFFVANTMLHFLFSLSELN